MLHPLSTVPGSSHILAHPTSQLLIYPDPNLSTHHSVKWCPTYFATAREPRAGNQRHANDNYGTGDERAVLVLRLDARYRRCLRDMLGPSTGHTSLQWRRGRRGTCGWVSVCVCEACMCVYLPSPSPNLTPPNVPRTWLSVPGTRQCRSRATGSGLERPVRVSLGEWLLRAPQRLFRGICCHQAVCSCARTVALLHVLGI